MGTNYYFKTSNKYIALEAIGGFEQEEDGYYYLHLAKTSCGWLPLFQASIKIKEVSNIYDIYQTYSQVIQIVDGAGEEMSIVEFTNRVLRHNGGTIAGRRFEAGAPGSYKGMVPMSHLEYLGSKEVYTDALGYEFSITEFS